MDDIEHRLFVAPQLLGDGRSSFAAIGCQQNLAAAQYEGIGGAQPCLDLATLVFGERSDKERSFHAFYYTTLSITFRDFALGKGIGAATADRDHPVTALYMGLLGPPIHFTTLSSKNKEQRKEQACEGHR